MSITRAELEDFILLVSFKPALSGLCLDSMPDSKVLARELAKGIHDELLRNAKPGR